MQNTQDTGGHDSLAEDNSEGDTARDVALRAPIDQMFQRGNGPRPPTMPASLRDKEQFMHASPTLDPRSLSTIEGYGEDTMPYIAPAATAFDTLHQVVQQIIAAREASRKNPSWTEGMAVIHVAALASKLQDKATRYVDGTLANLSKSIAGTEEMLRAPITTGANTPIASDVCLYMRGLDAAERMKLINAAIDKGDVVTLGAVLGRPGYLSGLTDEMQRVLLAAYNKKKNPEAAKRLAVMKAAHERLTNAGSLFLTQVERAMGVKWDKAQKLRAAQTEAERAFVLKSA